MQMEWLPTQKRNSLYFYFVAQWVAWMRHIAPSCNMVIPTVVEDNEMPGGRAFITPEKKKEAIGKEEGGIWLFSDFYAPLLHYLTLKLSYSDGMFVFLIEVWPLRFSSLSPATSVSFLFITHILSSFFFLPHLCISFHSYRLNPSRCFLPFLHPNSLWALWIWIPRKHEVRSLLLCPKAFHLIS